MRKPVTVLLIVFVLLNTSCPLDDIKSGEQKFIIVSWNVQNLFNGKQDGNEYSEYLPASGWLDSFYQSRLSKLNTVMSYSPLNEADVIVLNEVENDSVVEDILSFSFFRKNGFIFYATAGEPDGAIKTAVISKVPIINAKVHSTFGVRPVLEVEIQSADERVFILALHAKSNKEGIESTASMRLKQAELTAAVSADIKQNCPDALIVIAGDFNETYESSNMMCDARNLSNDCPLKLLPDFRFGYWYCPWMDSKNDFQAQGSYYYNNHWYSYDNILVSYEGKNGKGWELEKAGVVFRGILQTTDYKPNAFRRELLTGVSDHLPVWACFSKVFSPL